MKITRQEFDAYEEVRESGQTNMCALNTVTDLSGLTKEKVLAIMKDYGNLYKRYFGEE